MINLLKAYEEMVYDQGVTPTFIGSLYSMMGLVRLHGTDSLEVANEWLGKLTEEQLTAVCVGDQEELSIPENINTILEDLFTMIGV